jgi:DNA-binding transcriptional ArsR family regulator
MRRGNSPHTIATINFRSPQAVKTKKVGRPSRDSKFKEAARIYSLLGDATRLKVVQLLRDQGELCFQDIVEKLNLGISSVAIGHHTRMLWRGGILNQRPEGRFSYYSVDRDIVNKYLPDNLF